MSSMVDRRKDFKKGVDAGDARRRRGETAVSLRKNKREEGLAKRRNLTPSSPVRGSEAASCGGADGVTGARRYVPEDIPTLLAAISSPDVSEVVRACRGFRKMLSAEDKPPVDAVIAAGTVPKLVECLSRSESSELQFEAAWALTNIASTDKTSVIVECGALPPLIAMLTNESADLREQCAWCLGNVAGDSPALRDICLGDGAALNGLLLNITQPANRSLLGNCVWALSNFCRGKPQPDLSLVGAAIPTLVQLLAASDDEVQTDAGWALSYLSDGSSERVSACLSAGAAAPLTAMLSSPNSSVVTPALRALGNIVTGDDLQTQAALDAGSLPALARLLSHPKKAIRKETCWMLSNIAAGNKAQIGAMCACPGILPGVLNILAGAEWDVQREAAWVVSNVATGGTRAHIQHLVDQGVLKPLCALLGKQDTKIITVTLDALEAILKCDDPDSSYGILIDEADGLDAIEQLQLHENEQVYTKAVNIIAEFFGSEEDDEGNDLQPKGTESGFQFGVSAEAGQTFDFGLAG
jgi:importin subunit alpha-1